MNTTTDAAGWKIGFQVKLHEKKKGSAIEGFGARFPDLRPKTSYGYILYEVIRISFLSIDARRVINDSLHPLNPSHQVVDRNRGLPIEESIQKLDGESDAEKVEGFAPSFALTRRENRRWRGRNTRMRCISIISRYSPKM